MLKGENVPLLFVFSYLCNKLTVQCNVERIRKYEHPWLLSISGVLKSLHYLKLEKVLGPSLFSSVGENLKGFYLLISSSLLLNL